MYYTCAGFEVTEVLACATRVRGWREVHPRLSVTGWLLAVGRMKRVEGNRGASMSATCSHPRAVSPSPCMNTTSDIGVSGPTTTVGRPKPSAAALQRVDGRASSA